MTTQTNKEKQSSQTTDMSSKTKCIAAGVVLTLASVCGQQTTAQTTVNDSTKVEASKPTGGAFSIDPTYSPTDKVVTTRLSGGSSVHGVDAGGFLDLTGYPNVNSAFGKFTVSKGIKKGVSVGVEYTLNSEAPDKIRSGVILKHKLANGKVVYKLYPVGDKGFEPFVLVGVDQKLGEKAFASAFCGTDIKGKGYYGEFDITRKITRQIDALFQTRVGGTYSTKPKAGVYVGARVKFK